MGRLVFDYGDKIMSVKFLSSIGVRSIEKRVSKKEVEVRNTLLRASNLTAYRNRIVNYLRQVQAYCSGVDGKYNKNVMNAVQKNEASGSYEISLIRNNIPLMWGKDRYLSVDGDISDVVEKLELLINGMVNGQLDSVIKEHRKRVNDNKKSVK